MPRPLTTDPRAELIDWDVIDLSQTPPVEDWSDEDWEDAVLGTMAHQSRKEREEGRGGPTLSFEEVLAKRGFTMEDLDSVEDDDWC